MSFVLSLFPGIGMLDQAFEEEGFCVVRGPDVLWGGDIRRFHPPPGRFDGIIGGPPCQAFSSLAALVRAKGYEPKFGNLIPEFERCVTEAGPSWFLMENVRQAPVASVDGYAVADFLFNNAWVAGADGFGQEQERVRRFSFGVRGASAPDLRRWIQPAALMLMEPSRSVTALGVEHLSNLAESTMRVRKARSRPVKAMHDHPDNITDWSRRKRLAAVCAGGSGGGPGRPECRRGAVTSSDGGKGVKMCRYSIADALRLQGLPPDFLEHAPFTKEGKMKAIANGVPLPMGRAIAKAVKESTK